jgi:hypothetical protein
MRDEDEASDEAETALREHESLDEARRKTVPFLRDILVGALAEGRTSDEAIGEAYDRAADLGRLDGTLPDGLFGRAAKERHRQLLRCWRDGLAEVLGRPPAGLTRIWFGGAPEHLPAPRIERAVTIEPLVLEGGVTIELGGGTELLEAAGDATGPAGEGAEMLAVAFMASKEPSYAERELLRPFFTHLLLSASGLAAGRPLRVLLVRPPRTGAKAHVRARRFAALPAEAARRYLSELAGELLREVHPYFLPCEAIFSARTKRAEGRSVRDTVLLLRDDDFTRFLSDRGPVPDPRRYPVPATAEAEAMATRRFGLFYELMANGE